MLKRAGGIPYIIWTIMFIILPILIISYYSVTLADGSVSLSNFRLFFDARILNVVKRSLFTATMTTVICLLLGYPLAFFISKVSKKTEKFLVVLLVLPMWMNFLLRTYAWQAILGKNGVINNLLNFVGLPSQHLMFTGTAVILVMVYNFLPFMVLPIYTVIKKIDKGVLEAAEDLGANSVHVFFRVVLPLSVPGIVSGVSMTFLPAVSSFVIPDLIGGGKFNMIGNQIEKQFLLMSNWHFGSALSMVLVLMILISVYFTNRYADDEGGQLW
ncbi:ABC transporter permease [Acidaminobacter sp. JC074]|uniref:ABC transporter permease n=1 Tax=Acidaminobacter sp. JC074 TaxID=2530199 RepID=UPI001F114711|nr:ABC transporter permease [Acidaminobacter sp. JC074]MCH4889798.1 ABC transporter permease [Acidaminobacter sp. JC074]